MRKLLISIGLATMLSGCEVPVMIAAEKNQGQMTSAFEVTFPAVLLVQFNDGTEKLLTGQMVGHMNGSAKYALTGPNWGNCTGAYSRDGVNTMSCDTGFTVRADMGKQKAKMSGVNVFDGQSPDSIFVSAFGWGNNANEADVRAAIAAHRSM